MSELFGVCNSNGLSTNSRSGFDCMIKDLLTPQEGQLSLKKLEWTSFGTVSWHKNDYTKIEQDKQTASSFAWIGNSPDHTIHSPYSIVDKLHNNDFKSLKNLIPSFAMCVADSNSLSFWLISDIYGHYPVYYTHQKGELIFSSRFTSLLKNPSVQWDLDRNAVADFFTYEQIMGDKTFADTVKVLPQGTVLKYHSGHVETFPYFDILDNNLDFPSKEIPGLLYKELSNSIKNKLKGKKRVAVTLSGGLDSRALLGTALKHHGNIKTYTLGQPDCADITCAKQIAGISGVPNTAIEINGSYLPEWIDHGIRVSGGMVNCINYHILALAEILASEADIVLDGLGGDALTGSHIKLQMLYTRNHLKAANILFKQRATAWNSLFSQNTIFQNDFLDRDYDTKNAIIKHFAPWKEVWKGAHSFDLKERQRRFIQYGPHSMRPFIEVQTPFYNKNITDITSNMPLSRMLLQKSYYEMHSRYLPLLAVIPNSSDNIPLNRSFALRFLDKAKNRISGRLLHSVSRPATLDYAKWFREDLSTFIIDTLINTNSKFDEIFRKETIENLQREHTLGISDHTIKIGCLLTFKTWAQSLS